MANLIGRKITTDSIVFHVDFSNRKCFAPNILNYSNWTISTGDVSTDTNRYGMTQYIANGQTGENSRVTGVDPFGYAGSVVWKSNTVDTTTPTGDGGFDTGSFAIDNTKMYRFTVWTNRNAMTAGPTFSGAFYLGHYSWVLGGGLTFSEGKVNGNPTANPYHHITPNSNPSILPSVEPPYLGGINVWTLVVGHVWPVYSPVLATLPGTNINGLVTNGNHPDSGVWTRSLGKIGNCNMGQDYIWNPNTQFASHRAYHFYAGDVTATQSFIYPRVDIVDGLEPSIQELLAGSEPVRDLSPNMNVLYPMSVTNFDSNGKGLVFGTSESTVLRGTMSATFSAETVSVWFNPEVTINSASSGQTLLQFGATSSSFYFMIALGSWTGGAVDEVVSIESNYPVVTTGLTALTSNTYSFAAGVWNNITISWNGTKYLMYINGTAVATVAGTGGYGGRNANLPTSVNFMSIGARSFVESGIFIPYGAFFRGKIGSVVVYERSLESAEILSNYNALKKKYGLI